MARLTRHEILKEDRFLLTVETVRDFFWRKRKQILLGIGAIALVTLLGMGWFYYSAHQNERAKDELSQALKIYHSPVVTAAQGQAPAQGVRRVLVGHGSLVELPGGSPRGGPDPRCPPV